MFMKVNLHEQLYSSFTIMGMLMFAVRVKNVNSVSMVNL